MYFYERLIGIVIYCLLLFFFTIVIYKGNKNELKRTLFIYTICLSIMGFYFVPVEGNDIYRINELLTNVYSQLDFNNLFDMMRETMTPVATMLYFAVAKTKINSLLPAIVSFLVFNNLFFIVSDYVKKNKICNKTVGVTVLFLMSTGFFMEVISGIRTMLAFSILARCFYNELYNNKSIIKNGIWYIIAIFIHSSAIGIIGLRIIYLIFFNKKYKAIYKIFVLIGIIFAYVLFKNYIINSLHKFDSYLYDDNKYFWIWEFIKIIFLIITDLTIIKKYKKLNLNKYYQFNLIIIGFTVALISEFNIFLRFNYFNVFIIIPIVLNVVQNIYDNKITKGNCWIVYSSIVLLILSCSRGNLSSLKFFEL